ncbi:3'-5' exonuclease [Roseburia faecis]
MKQKPKYISLAHCCCGWQDWMYYLEEFYKERYCGRKPAIFWLVFFSYMCIINMYESVRQVHKMDYTVLDLEMTGLAPKRDKVIEIGAVRVRNGEIADTYGTLVRPGMSIPETVVQLTGITDEMAALGKEENVAMQELLQFIGDDILVGHNLIFDYSFLKQWAVNQKIPLELSACDTLRIARALLPGAQSKKLESLCEYFQIEREHAHRALDDAVETYKVFENLKSIEGASMELFVPKPLVYKAKRQTPATEHQKERLRELMEQYGRKDSISWETLTRSEASRLQDKIRAGNFQVFPE